MYTEVAKNKRNSIILMLIFMMVVIAIGWVFALALNEPYILYGCAGFAVIYTWISYYNSDKMALAASRARQVKKNDAPELYRIVENLAITAGLPVPKVYIIDDTAPNAFATGRDPDHAVICVTTGLLQKLNKAELEGVIAHELSHVGNYDIRFMSLVVVLVAVVALMSDMFLRISFWGDRDNDRRGDSQMQMVFMAIGLALAILAPIVGTLMQLALSRKREYLADASGALLTRYPQGLANALRKISDDTDPLKEANKATANLYIINPFRANIKGGHGARTWFAGLFSTHPPTPERIKRLEDMDTHA